MSELAKVFESFSADVAAFQRDMKRAERVKDVDHDHKQRNTGYQDAMHDLQEVIQKTDVRTGVAIWLAHGRNWKEHL